MPTAKLSSKSQIVVPAEIRRKLHLRVGDLLEIDMVGETATLRKAKASHTDQLLQCASEIWVGYAEEVARERARWDT